MHLAFFNAQASADRAPCVDISKLALTDGKPTFIFPRCRNYAVFSGNFKLSYWQAEEFDNSTFTRGTLASALSPGIRFEGKYSVANYWWAVMSLEVSRTRFITPVGYGVLNSVSYPLEFHVGVERQFYNRIAVRLSGGKISQFVFVALNPREVLVETKLGTAISLSGEYIAWKSRTDRVRLKAEIDRFLANTINTVEAYGSNRMSAEVKYVTNRRSYSLEASLGYRTHSSDLSIGSSRVDEMVTSVGIDWPLSSLWKSKRIESN